MLHNTLAGIICKTFETQCGRWQIKKPVPSAFLVNFRMHDRPSKDDRDVFTRRTVQLALYAPSNYVGVAVREGEFVLNGFVQREPVTPWQRLSYHDRCWRSDGVEQFIHREQDQIAYVDDLFTGNWFTIEPVTDDLLACINGSRLSTRA